LCLIQGFIYIIPYAFKIERTIYKHHRLINTKQLTILLYCGPPNSPPITTLRTIKIKKQITATIKKTKTENATAPAGTLYY